MSAALHLILLAGGRGLRAAGTSGVPKQFRVTGQGALFAVSLDSFRAPPPSAAVWHLASVTVTAPAVWRENVVAELETGDLPWQLAEPGATRTASTGNAVAALATAVGPGAGDLVAVHDAARPFATYALLDALATAAVAHGGAVPGLPVSDTIVRTDGETASYLPRESLVAVQTPQVFGWSAFAADHRWARDNGATFTDDGGLAAARGHAPVIVPGEPGNWKVTTAADWARAAAILR